MGKMERQQRREWDAALGGAQRRSHQRLLAIGIIGALLAAAAGGAWWFLLRDTSGITDSDRALADNVFDGFNAIERDAMCDVVTGDGMTKLQAVEEIRQELAEREEYSIDLDATATDADFAEGLAERANSQDDLEARAVAIVQYFEGKC